MTLLIINTKHCLVNPRKCKNCKKKAKHPSALGPIYHIQLKQLEPSEVS